MIDYTKKICPELLKVATLNEQKNTSDCLIYANDFRSLKNKIQRLDLSFFEYPFIKAVGLKLNFSQIIKLQAFVSSD